MAGESSGTELVNTLIDGVQTGDNLVLQGDGQAPLELLVARFTACAQGRMPLVLVNVAAPWSGPVPDGAIVLDWSPARTGQPSALPNGLAPDASFAQALATLHDADEQVGKGAAFVFDELTAVQDAWGQDAALELFLSACPRLYRRRSLAVWPVRAAAHRPSFLRRLAEITQVVVEIMHDDGTLQLTVRKADGRAASVVGRRVGAAVVDGDLEAIDAPHATREQLGPAIRDQRLARGVSQAELARRVGISPSALSQVERGVRGLAGDTLVRLWEALGVPFGPAAGHDPGYRIARRSGRERPRLQDGLTGERILDDGLVGEVWSLEVAAGATGSSAPFAVKSPETIIVLHGVLDLLLAGRTETLHEGDALVAADVSVTGWANPGGTAAEVLWMVHRTRTAEALPPG